MRKRFQPVAIVTAFMLVSMIPVPASGHTSAMPDLTAPEAAWEQPLESLSAATRSPAADPGIIAYVRRSTDDIHVIAPDGTGDRVLWTAPLPLGQVPPIDLAWRPDGRELAFSSGHEETCSWYQSDVYGIGYNGTGYRRITNAPACAVLATLPKGSVTVDAANYTGSSWVQAYVQGAPGIKSVLGSGTVTFDNVADLGPGVPQPAVGIYGLYRFPAYPPYPDVQPNASVPGGNLVIMPYSGIDGFGAGKVTWKADGSALGYGMRTATINQIPAIPPYGSIGEMLPVVTDAASYLVAWGPTAATKDQYLYYATDNPLADDIEGIYLNTLGNASGGTKLVSIDAFNATQVFDLEWLPDGSGFLFSQQWVPLDIYSDIFEYDFASQEITQVTSLHDDSARGFSISPDGQYIVFERTVDPVSDPTSSLWIINRDGSGLHMLAGDAGRPAWGPSPVPLQPRGYLPVLVR